ncbi:MAG: RNase P subunit p30 family protein [Candidatus Micrarchaeota archaeon]
MDYADLHVRFPAKNLGELGFARAGILGENLVEVKLEKPRDANMQKQTGKLLVFSSPNPSLLSQFLKRADFVFLSIFEPDMELLRACITNKKVLEIPVSPLLKARGMERAKLLAKMRIFLRILNKMGAEYVITSRAENEYSIKSPEELIAIGELLGLTHGQAVRAVSVTPLAMLAEAGKC